MTVEGRDGRAVVHGNVTGTVNQVVHDGDTVTVDPDGNLGFRFLAVTPYFIWPNVDPYRRQSSLTDAVPQPGGLTPAGRPRTEARALDNARQAVRDARAAHLGVFDAQAPLKILPFE